MLWPHPALSWAGRQSPPLHVSADHWAAVFDWFQLALTPKEPLRAEWKNGVKHPCPHRNRRPKSRPLWPWPHRQQSYRHPLRRPISRSREHGYWSFWRHESTPLDPRWSKCRGVVGARSSRLPGLCRVSSQFVAALCGRAIPPLRLVWHLGRS